MLPNVKSNYFLKLLFLRIFLTGLCDKNVFLFISCSTLRANDILSAKTVATLFVVLYFPKCRVQDIVMIIYSH